MVNSLLFKQKKTHLKLEIVSSLFLALVSVFSPYLMFQIGSGANRISIRITDFFLLVISFLSFLKYKNVKLKNIPLLVLYFFLTIITTLSIFFNESFNSFIALKSIVITFATIILYYYVWMSANQELFYKYVSNIGVFISLLAILQFLFGHLGLPMWDGRLPFFPLYGHWSGFAIGKTNLIRPNSIFQEASYVGLYLIPALVITIKQKRYFRMFLFVLALFVSSSLVSIAGSLFVLFYMFLFANKSKEMKIYRKRFIFFVVTSVILYIILYNITPFVRDTTDYVFFRLLNLNDSITGERMSSEKFRLLGFIGYYDYYTFPQKIVGLGENQFSIYFGLDESYSNNFVTCLLNFGFIGILCFAVFLVFLYRNIDIENRVFFWVAVFVMAVDCIWFNTHFFFALTPLFMGRYIKNNKRGKIQ